MDSLFCVEINIQRRDAGLDAFLHNKERVERLKLQKCDLIFCDDDQFVVIYICYITFSWYNQIKSILSSFVESNAVTHRKTTFCDNICDNSK